MTVLTREKKEEEEDKNNDSRMEEILKQLSDIQKFIEMCKRILDLDEEMGSDSCLTYIVNVLERMKMNKYNDVDLIM